MEKRRIPVKSTAKIENRVMEFPMAFPASASRLPPMAWPMEMVLPITSATITTVSMCITWLPMDTAVTGMALLKRPVMKRSANP